MKLTLRNKHLSSPRYSRYLVATANNKERAKKLYNANIQLAQAFHPLLSQFEVVLRNSLNIVLSGYFSDPDWIINQNDGFMRDLSLNPQFFLKNAILKTESKLTRRSIPITSGKIISDQTLGFWVAFFLAHHYSLVGGRPIHIFPGKPAIENRASIHAKLDAIQGFRNRVSHCEPLCFVGHNIDCSAISAIRTTLYNLIGWIDPQLIPFFEKIDTVQRRINQIMAI
ncbi:hypothetical protein F0L74_02225 [Chitinophaga agrisoli]|uniref:Abi-like protein n=1 Tax=Chitinophaga agrisoli TaxID=2607653 RepID=A0A5B2VY69_9BACT|nr:hypothetical protein [Chitinophaga agrisoli]KAA2244803.1 hypothetical protein F0L74_02225 [Chitinophaga agrisoli]